MSLCCRSDQRPSSRAHCICRRTVMDYLHSEEVPDKHTPYEHWCVQPPKYPAHLSQNNNRRRGFQLFDYIGSGTRQSSVRRVVHHANLQQDDKSVGPCDDVFMRASSSSNSVLNTQHCGITLIVVAHQYSKRCCTSRDFLNHPQRSSTILSIKILLPARC